MTGKEPTLPVLIGPTSQEVLARLAAGRPLSSAWGTGYLDTGTSVTCVATSLLQQLGLQSAGQANSQTAAGQIKVRLYEISLTIPPPGFCAGPMLTRESLLVMELADPIPGVDVLIGLDILLDCKFLLDGPARQFTLDF